MIKSPLLHPVRFAFGFKAQHGKDTSADIVARLLKDQGQDTTHMKFAAPLYDILHYAQTMCGFPIEKDRAFLQYIGTDWARAKSDTVWCDTMEKRVGTTPGHILVTDLRFSNEAVMLKRLGFILVHVHRPDSDSFSSLVSTHASETEMDTFDGWDETIVNDGTLADLERELNDCLHRHYPWYYNGYTLAEEEYRLQARTTGV